VACYRVKPYPTLHNSMAYQHCDGMQQYGIPAPLPTVKHYINIINSELRKIQLNFVLFQQYFHIMKQEYQQIFFQSNTIIYSTIISTTLSILTCHHQVQQEQNSTNHLKMFFHLFCNIQKRTIFNPICCQGVSISTPHPLKKKALNIHN